MTELNRLGIAASEHDDGFSIVPGQPTAGTVETDDDHRMAMSFALLGLVNGGISIADPGCVAKTFPSYWEFLEGLRPHAGGPRSAMRIVAIDGPAGSGKSTISRSVAEALGVAHLDTGAMYRAV